MDYHTSTELLILIVSALLLGTAVRHLLKNFKIPYTLVLLLLGLAIGLLDRYSLASSDSGSLTYTISQRLHLVVSADPRLILFLFLPTLIFEAAFAIEPHLFRRTFTQISTLAVPGLLLAVILTAILVKYALPWDWSWTVALLFGALISATDPVAVVALLREVSSRKRLETLIEGESLLNDGTAIVLFGLLMTAFVAGDLQQWQPWSAVVNFVWVVIGGVLVGLLLGEFILTWIGRVFNDPLIEITLSVVSAYLAFFIAEDLLHVSGVLAVVTLALMFASQGRTRVSPEVTEFLQHFWEVMAYLANTLIFLGVGIIIARRISFDDSSAWLALLITYVGIQLVRMACIALFAPLLNRIGIGLDFNKAVVLALGGLRGAIALALALLVAQHPATPKELGDQILFLTAGIVVLSIVINGGSLSWLLAWLKLNRLPAAKQATVDKAELHIEHALAETAVELQNNPLLANADWQLIGKDIVPRTVIKPSSCDLPGSQPDLLVAFQYQLLEGERAHYWQQFAAGTMHRETVQHLVEAVEQTMDGKPTLAPRPQLDRYWQMPALAIWLSESPILKKPLHQFAFTRLARAYDLAHGFLLAQEANRSHLRQLNPPEEIHEIIDTLLQQNISEVRHRLHELKQRFPRAAERVETAIGGRLLLNRRRQVIEQLHAEGVLAGPETQRLTQQVEEKMALLDRGKFTAHIHEEQQEQHR
jgi:NhaP-type Na+/H+ or K+/H+ antiporter